MKKRRLLRSMIPLLVAGVFASSPSIVSAATSADGQKPAVLIALDAEFGHTTSTSDDAIRMGILTAIDEINEAGGVAGGRKLALIESDNRSVPARGRENFRKHATNPAVLAVFTGKFSPVVLDQAKLADELKLPLLDPWAAADPIISANPAGTYTFRLSLRDSWAVPAMMSFLRSRGIRKVGAMLPTSGWGRSNEAAIKNFAARSPAPEVVGVEWYNWGTPSMEPGYRRLQGKGAEAILLVANELEGSILVREVFRMPPASRLPIVSHWGVSGGAFVDMVGEELKTVDFSVVQTFTFVGRKDAKSQAVIARAGKLFGGKSCEGIPSHVGFAHAYDLTHLLAQAIMLAGSADRVAVRDALERVRDYRGLTGTYKEPFTPRRHEAMSPDHVFIGRFMPSGCIERISN